MEVDGGALQGNVALARRLMGGKGELMAVVKANGYGHGVGLVLRALKNGVEQFAVANVKEAVQIAGLVDPKRITVLSPALPFEREEVAGRGFLPMVSSWEEADAYARWGRVGRPVGIHLCVDTGMGRMGVWEEEAWSVAAAIRELPGVVVRTVASHLPCADEDDEYTRAQLQRFHRLGRELCGAFFPEAGLQVENSAGLLAFPGYAGDVVRAGLMLYGESPRPEFQRELQPVMAWKTRVALVRSMETGRGISYGRTYRTPAPMQVATLAVGYADGYRRQMSGRGAMVLVGGRRCAVLGRITMDQVMVDVTGVPDLEPGSEAVLLGRQKSEAIWARELAVWAGSIPWEIFTGIGERVEREPCEGNSSA